MPSSGAGIIIMTTCCHGEGACYFHFHPGYFRRGFNSSCRKSFLMLIDGWLMADWWLIDAWLMDDLYFSCWVILLYDYYCCYNSIAVIIIIIIITIIIIIIIIITIVIIVNVVVVEKIRQWWVDRYASSSKPTAWCFETKFFRKIYSQKIKCLLHFNVNIWEVHMNYLI